MIESFIAVNAAGPTPEITGLRNVTCQRLSGAELVSVVLETDGAAATGVVVGVGVGVGVAEAVAVAPAVSADVGVDATPEPVAVGPAVDGG